MLNALTSQGFLNYPMTLRPLYTTLHLTHHVTIETVSCMPTSHIHNPNQTVITPMNGNTIDKLFPAHLTPTQPHKTVANCTHGNGNTILK